jgi:hypothetical protein
MSELDPHVDTIVAADELVARLATAIAFEQDTKLQAGLRRFAGVSDAKPAMIRLPRSATWLEIGPRRVGAVHRAPVEDIVEIRSDEAIEADEKLREVFVGAMARAKAVQQARRLLRPLFDTSKPPTREHIRSLLKWSPVIEHDAYQYCAHATLALDSLRPVILKEIGSTSAMQSSRLVEYWNCVHAMGHLTLLASTPGARPWLVEMAESFVWVSWTPTFPLLRERTLWLAALAARSAIAFGEPVIEKYMACLAISTHAMKSFDAIFGLVAIALDQPNLAGDLVTELVKLQGILARQPFPHGSYTNRAIETAVEVLREPDAAQREFKSRVGFADDCQECGLSKMFAAATLRSDPADILPSGKHLGLIALPLIVGMAPEGYYPLRPPRRSEASTAPDEISAIMQHTWLSDSGNAAPRVVH